MKKFILILLFSSFSLYGAEQIQQNKLDKGVMLSYGECGVRKDLRKAKQLLENVISNDQASASLKTEAKFELGKLLYLNSTTKERANNYPYAYVLFNDVINSLSEYQELNAYEKIMLAESKYLKARSDEDVIRIYS